MDSVISDVSESVPPPCDSVDTRTGLKAKHDGLIVLTMVLLTGAVDTNGTLCSGLLSSKLLEDILQRHKHKLSNYMIYIVSTVVAHRSGLICQLQF